MGKWVNSLWKGQRELINAMRIGSFIVIKDLDNIKVMVDKLGVENAQFTISEEEEDAVGSNGFEVAGSSTLICLVYKGFGRK
ncbi:UPF0496 protein-like protein, partial [Tanacetum coccineum]